MWNLEQGFPKTTLALFKDPKKTINTYLFEDRGEYVHPLRFVFATTALSFLITLNSKAYQAFMVLANRRNAASIEERPELGELIERTLEIYYSSMQIIFFLSLPIVALITYLLLNKRQFNFWEHIAINAFVFGAIAIISAMVSIPFMPINSPWPVGITMFLSFALYIWFYKKIFEHNWFRTILGFLISYGIGYMLTAIGVALIIMIYVGITMARAGTFG